MLRLAGAIVAVASSSQANDIAGMPVCQVTLDSNSDGPARRVNPHIMGCHSDSGYAHQSRALFAELLYGNAFEQVPDPPSIGVYTPELLNSWFGVGGARLESSEPLITGGTPLLLTKPGDAAINRGFAGEGLHFRESRDYEGYVLLRSRQPVAIDVSLQTLDGVVLANTSIKFSGGDWTKLDFNLRSSRSTECNGIDFQAAQVLGIACPRNNTYKSDDPMSDRAAHICVQCDGQFVISLGQGASARIGYVSLQPGTWGRFAGLPVHLEAVKALQSIGVTVIRQGGSFELNGNMAWQHQRGPVWNRTSSVNGNWYHADVSGWGMFEMIDLANSMNVTPIITTYYKIEPADYADLLEYCWGDANTKWGALRISDGHPAPYAVRHFELGNEEPNPRFVEQVQAMEAKAEKLGIGNTMSYILSNGWGRNWPNTTQMKKAAALGLGTRLIWDIHVNGGGATDVADYFFSNASYNSWAAMNLETNYGDHTVRRMLGEAEDLNLHFNYANPRLLGRTASFCMERSGYNEGGLNDQGLIFFLPNMTWLQPAGHVHSMITETWQPLLQKIILSGNCGSLAAPGGISAQTSEDGGTVVLRVVNSELGSRRLVISTGHDVAQMTFRTIASSQLDGANTPGQPLLIAPSVEENITAAMAADLRGQSFSVFLVKHRQAEVVLV